MTYDCRSQGRNKTCVHGPHGHVEAELAHTDKTEDEVLDGEMRKMVFLLL